MRVEDDFTDMVDTKQGIRQGCVLSPHIFTLYGEVLLKAIEMLDNIGIGGRKINNIR